MQSGRRCHCGNEEYERDYTILPIALLMYGLVALAPLGKRGISFLSPPSKDGVHVTWRIREIVYFVVRGSGTYHVTVRMTWRTLQYPCCGFP